MKITNLVTTSETFDVTAKGEYYIIKATYVVTNNSIYTASGILNKIRENEDNINTDGTFTYTRGAMSSITGLFAEVNIIHSELVKFIEELNNTLENENK